MHISHQKHLIANVRTWAAAIETALSAEHEDTVRHPATVAERKATILRSLDNLRRELDQVDPVLREQNQ